MNETIRLLKERYTVRNFIDKQISDEDLRLIKDSIVRSPTAGNMQDYSVIIVKEKQNLETLSKLCDNQPLIAKSPMALIFIGDFTRYSKYYEYNNLNFTANSSTFILSIVDALIACNTAALACESLNIGTCYIGDICENRDEVVNLLNLQPTQFPIAMLSIGYHESQKRLTPRIDEKFIFHEEKYEPASIDELHKLFDREVPKKFKDQSYIEFQYNRKVNTDFYSEMDQSIKKYLKDFK